MKHLILAILLLFGLTTLAEAGNAQFRASFSTGRQRGVQRQRARSSFTVQRSRQSFRAPRSSFTVQRHRQQFIAPVVLRNRASYNHYVAPAQIVVRERVVAQPAQTVVTERVVSQPEVVESADVSDQETELYTAPVVRQRVVVRESAPVRYSTQRIVLRQNGHCAPVGQFRALRSRY